MTRARELFPGTIIAFITALSAQYLADQYGAPVMLFALLLGMALNFLNEQEQCCPGISFTSQMILRIGVALLGLRITLYQVHSIGYDNLTVVALAVAATIGLGALLANVYNKAPHFGVLTGGSVAIASSASSLPNGSLNGSCALPVRPSDDRSSSWLAVARLRYRRLRPVWRRSRDRPWDAANPC